MSFTNGSESVYVDVLLPLAIPKAYTYSVPIEYHDQVKVGIRVEVPLRNKLYSAIVTRVHREVPVVKTRHIIALLDESPIVTSIQLDFWKWMSDYYCAHPGAVMNVALPSGLKLSSESKLMLNADVALDEIELSDDEYLISEALTIQHELSILEIQDILNKKTVYPIIKSLLKKRVINIQEELQVKYKEKTEKFVKIAGEYANGVEAAMALTARSDKQARAVLSYFSLSRKVKHVPKKAVQDMADVDSGTINAVAKKGIWSLYDRSVSRIDLDGDDTEYPLDPLSPRQAEVHQEIKETFEEGKVVLLHGVTGSGKTRVYIELINEVLRQGGQVLYMLPEIALTTQIVERLRSQIGDQLYVYHSQINDAQRVEIYNAAMMKNKLFIGARSSLFLPFYDLKLIIVDEEHDHSYKQEHPNPKYQGRDCAVKLATYYDANVILGSATPSLESVLNTRKGKYRYIAMMERYGMSVLPDIRIVNLKEAYKKGLVTEGFSAELIEEITETVARGEQVILFQNRRGYAPILKCRICGWAAECTNCDVSLTYHQHFNELKCHYCGHRTKKPDNCPGCGSHELQLIGAGTEKIEDVVKQLIPKARVARFDYDTTRSKKNARQLLDDYKMGRIDILVGTQMITKGFDFENIALVGVLYADSLLSFPDYRAAERSFQLLMQVGGRAGRRSKQGKVLIQAFQTAHPVLSEVVAADYDRFYARELHEREQYVYPPFFHMISIWFKHKDLRTAKAAADFFYKSLRPQVGKRVSAPVDPIIIRVRGYYQQVVHIKVEKTGQAASKIKALITDIKNKMSLHKEHKRVRVDIDVDPY